MKLFVALGICTVLIGTVRSQGIVQGHVKDADTKESLIGVTIKITDTKLGGRTDSKGNYRIANVPPGKHTILAHILGYSDKSASVTVDADQPATADFAISVQALQQEDVVVMGLSGDIDRKTLGTSIGAVDGKEIVRVVSPTAIDAISGRVAGTSVSKSSGTAGAGTYLTIRGRKTISGSSEPLYVVDGILIDNSSLVDDHQNQGLVQLGNRITDINPQDIESMVVLKGSSASALYGSLGANGVVVITTKRGTATNDITKSTVMFSSSAQTDMLAGSFPLQTIYGQDVPYAPGSNGAPGTPGSSTSYGPKLAPGTPTFDHSKDGFRNGTSLINTISISGGVPSFNYLLSGTVEDLKGITLNNDMTRHNLRLNLGALFIPELSIQSNTNYITTQMSLPQEGSNLAGILLGALRTSPEFDNNIAYEPDGSQRRYARYDNPIWTLENNHYSSAVDRITHSSTLNWTPFSWGSLEARVGLDHYEYENSERIAVGSGASVAPNRQGSVRHELTTTSNANTDLIAHFVWKPMDELVTRFEAGAQSTWGTQHLNDVASTSTLPFFDQLGAGSSQTAQSTELHTKTEGGFLTAQGTWLDRINLNLTLRRDNSSTFGVNNSFHYYKGGGLSYLISEEPFWSDVKSIISKFKLRASYGEAGNPSLPSAYATSSPYTTYGFNDPWGRTPILAARGGYAGIRQGGGTDQIEIFAGNPDIRPEFNIERELGFDLGLLNDRIDVEMSYYHQSIFDMIINVGLPASTGYDKVQKNGGSMWNTGFEWTINILPLKTDDITWRTGFTYFRNYNMVTSLNGVAPGGAILLTGGFTGMNNAAIVGKPLGVFYGVGWLRDSKGEIQYSHFDAESKTVVGDDFGLNLVGAPMQNSNGVILGDPNAHWQFSWKNDVTFFKDFTFSFLVDGMIGQQVWNGTKGTLYNFGTSADTKDRDAIWINFKGDTVMDYSNPNKPVPATRSLYYQAYGNGFYINEPFVEDGSYVKLREISLSYDWHGLTDWHIQNVRITATVRNLHTWTNYTGYDPEINTFAQSESRGYDYFTIPQSRSYRLSLSLTY